LPRVPPLSGPSPSIGHGGDEQSDIQDGTPFDATLPMISPNGQG